MLVAAISSYFVSEATVMTREAGILRWDTHKALARM